MAHIYSNHGVEEVIWSAISHSDSHQDYLDFLTQFPDPVCVDYFRVLDSAVERYSPADPNGNPQAQCYAEAFKLLEAHAMVISDPRAKGAALFHLGKMLQLGLGVTPDPDRSISFYQQAIDCGEIRALINCGSQFDKPGATDADLSIAHALFHRAAELGEGMGLARIAEHIQDDTNPQKYALLLQAAEMGLAFSQYKVGGAHYFGKYGQPVDEALGISWLQQAARGGSAAACEVLGYHFDRESSKDSSLSWEWQIRGARLGSAGCMHAMGLKLLLGVNRDPDPELALTWLRRSAVLGDERAQFRIGHHYLISENRQMHPQGVAWLRLAVENGHGYAAWRLAVAYREGIGIEQDLVKAAHYCQIAARAGYAEAQGQLGLFYWYGSGVEKDAQKAYQWLQMCALQGEAKGIYLLGLATENGVGCTPDIDQAVRLYEEAAEKGDLDAVNQVGDCFYFGSGKPKDPVQAAVWFRRAASKGHARSMTDLGRILSDGEGVITNYEEARRWFQKAADLDEPCGMYMLAMLYANGDGVEQDDEQCRRWMSRSAMLGYKPAKEWMQSSLPAAPKWLEDILQEATKVGADKPIEQQQDKQ